MTIELLGSALLLGCLGSTHCVAMCGGVAGLFCAGMPASDRTRQARMFAHVAGYNAGRVLSYAVAGALSGTLGARARDAMAVHTGQLALQVCAGIAMLIAGVYVGAGQRAGRMFERLGSAIWRMVEPIAGRVIPVRSPAHALALGLLWGWMPCGLLYAGLALAMTAGSAWLGAATMVAFAVGTLPAMLSMGALAGWAAKWLRHAQVRATAAVLLSACGVLNLAVVLAPTHVPTRSHCAATR